MTQVRPIDSAVIWGRRREQAEKVTQETSEALEIEVAVASNPDEAAAADVLVTATPATEPLVTPEMLHSGLHITAVGSDAETKQEIVAEAISASDVFVCDSIAHSSRLGELRAALASGFDHPKAVELGAVSPENRPDGARTIRSRSVI